MPSRRPHSTRDVDECGDASVEVWFRGARYRLTLPTTVARKVAKASSTVTDFPVVVRAITDRGNF